MNKLSLGQVLPNFNDDFPWYVALAKSRQEFIVVINLQRQGYKPTCPFTLVGRNVVVNGARFRKYVSRATFSSAQVGRTRVSVQYAVHRVWHR